MNECDAYDVNVNEVIFAIKKQGDRLTIWIVSPLAQVCIADGNAAERRLARCIDAVYPFADLLFRHGH